MMAIVILVTATESFAAPATEKSWSPRVSVERRQFDRGGGGYLVYGKGAAEPATFSPSGKYFLVVTFRGDLECDCFRYELDIYRSADVVQAAQRGQLGWPAPFAKISRSSHGNEIAIGRVEWQSDDAIIYEASAGSELPSLYRFSLISQTEERLSPTGVGSGSYSAAGAVVAMTFIQPNGILSPSLEYPASFAERGDVLHALGGGGPNFSYGLAVFDGTRATRLLDYKPGPFFGPWVSPDGKFAVVVAPVATDARWEAYRPAASQYGQLSRKFIHSQFLLVNLKTGFVKELIKAPTGLSTPTGTILPEGLPVFPWPSAEWSKDSKNIALLNTALPLDRKRSSGDAYTITYNLSSGKTSVLAPRVVSAQGKNSVIMAAQFSSGGDYLRIKSVIGADAYKWKVFKASGNDWVTTSDNALFEGDQPKLNRLKVETLEDMNTPPRLIARAEGGEQILSDPDPVLKDVVIRPSRVVRWKDRGGEFATGGLILPVTRPNAEPPPLIIQVYAFDPKTFLPDGTAYTAYAAQSLVAAGFAVLTINDPEQDAEFDPSLPPLSKMGQFRGISDRIDSAVNQLASEKLVDPQRVGYVGFSAGAKLAHYLISHPGRTQFKAVVAADGSTRGYVEYIFHLLGSQAQAWKSEMGGDFWDDKDSWLRESAWFNADIVRTPTLFTLGGKRNLPIFSEILASLWATHRPMDLLVFPEGEHQLQTPRERVASMQATLDWMKFWILGIDPADAGTAKRWGIIREEWMQQQKWEAVGHSVTTQPVMIGAGDGAPHCAVSRPFKSSSTGCRR